MRHEVDTSVDEQLCEDHSKIVITAAQGDSRTIRGEQGQGSRRRRRNKVVFKHGEWRTLPHAVFACHYPFSLLCCVIFGGLGRD